MHDSFVALRPVSGLNVLPARHLVTNKALDCREKRNIAGLQ
jgi:hypothetical protein